MKLIDLTAPGAKIPWRLRNVPLKDLPLTPESREALDRSTREAFKLLHPTAKRMLSRVEKNPPPLISEAKAALRAGDPEPFFRLLSYIPGLLQDEEFWGLSIGTWWPRKAIDSQEGKQAQKYLKRIGGVLADSHGHKMLAEEKREAIIAACKKWRPICKALNKVFTKLRKQPEYHSSGLYRKEARGRLAEKFGIPVADVHAIECYLFVKQKHTPTQAMLRMVAREFLGRGEKTIEKIWEDYLKSHPGESRKRRKSTTTPIAGRTP